MKKALLFRVILAVMIVSALNSCKKDDASYVNVSNTNTSDIVSENQNTDGLLRQGPFEQVLSQLALEYGSVFDFNSITTTTTPSGVSPSANLIVLPSTWYDNDLLTIVINGSAQILGLYEVKFTSGFSSIRDIETNSYEFEINSPEEPWPLFTGYVYTNVPYQSDYISTCLTPVNYPYPLFNYYTTGSTNLENYNVGIDTPGMNPTKLALKLASTFYIHFYLGD